MKVKLLTGAAVIAVGGLVLAGIPLIETRADTETQAQTAATDSAADPVVAVVDGRELRRSEVIESASSLPPAYQQNIEQLFPALVDRLIDLTLLAAEGRERNLQEDEAVREMVARFEDQAIREVLIQRHIEENVTDEAVQKRYEQVVENFEPQPEIRARHVLVESKEEAEAVIDELETGVDFAELAKNRSTGPSASQGGDLGYFTADQMVPEFAEAATALKTGEFTKEPVQTQFGWHVIKLEDRRETQPPSLEEARPEIEAELSQELVRTLLADLREGADIEKIEPPEAAAE